MTGRALFATFAALAAAALLTVQIGSDGFCAQAAAPWSLPAHLPVAASARILAAIAALKPNSFANELLAQRALREHRLDEALERTSHLRASSVRWDLEGKIALARGDREGATRALLAADDIDEVARAAERLAALSRYREAFALESALQQRIANTGTHPDALAESAWREGSYAEHLASSAGADAAAWNARARKSYEQAHALAPFSEKYLLAAGVLAFRMHDSTRSAGAFRAMLAIDPESANALAGLGLLAASRGDRSAARALLRHARSIDPQAMLVPELESRLR